MENMAPFHKQYSPGILAGYIFKFVFNLKRWAAFYGKKELMNYSE